MSLGRLKTGPVLRPGDTCWKISDCSHLAFLIDGKAYFDALAVAFAKAQRRIAIIGWDFDSRILLRPDRRGEAQLPLGRYLKQLVEARPDLEVQVLVWRNSIFYGRGAELMSIMGESWQDHPQISFKLDDHHPIGACHHQKIVVIDDKLAFVGGIDLTQRRWDDPGHRRNNPHRRTVEGKPHPSTHDLQVMVEGPVAVDIAHLAASRWFHLTGDLPPPLQVPGSIWPEHVLPNLRNHPVAIARTQPKHGSQEEAREIVALTTAMLKAAQRSIYVEAQYFALPDVAELMAEHLRRRTGPEIVIVVNGGRHGMVEQFAMTENRERMFTLLHKADRHSRLRIYFPIAEAVPPCPIKVHSKLLIVDDRLLRIGSANLNRRSTGLDTECDLAIEAQTEEATAAIAGLRSRLLAEHVGASEEEFSEVVGRTSAIRAIEAFNGTSPRLLLTAEQPNEEKTTLMTGSGLMDPRRPITLKTIWRWLST